MKLLLDAFRFALVAGANTLVGIILIYSLLFLGLSPLVANLAGYAVVIPLSYLAHARISFQKRRLKLRSFSLYGAAVFVSYLTNLVIMMAIMEVFHVNSYLAQIPAFAAYGLCFFFLNRAFVFAEGYVS